MKKLWKREWDYGATTSSSFKFGLLRFSKLYNRKLIWLRYTIAFVMGAVSGIFGFLLLQGTGIYATGLSGLFQGISRLVYFVMKVHMVKHAEVFYYLNFWILNLLANVPLAVFGYLKIGKNFASLTLTSMFATSLLGLVLSFSVHNFYLFGNPLTYDAHFMQYQIQILQWDHLSQTTLNSGQVIVNNDTARVATSLIYGFSSGVILTFPSIFIYIVGGSGGGSDWYGFYLSKKKQKSFSTFSFYLNLAVMFIAFIFGTYIPYVSVFVQNYAYQDKILVANFFSPVIFASLLSIWLRKVVINYLYPQFKVVNVKIYTKKAHEVREQLLIHKFNHAFTINRSIGGYSLKEFTNLEIVCFYQEIYQILAIVHEVDHDHLVVANFVNTLDGKFRFRSEFD